jgi:alpha-beta hydrolase superfamily lysophospholipase
MTFRMPKFDPSVFGHDVDAYLAKAEARFGDIKSGAQKRVVWAETPGQATDWSVLYVHGFSACSEEIRPVPDLAADALGANLVYTRLQGHGRSDEALGEGTLQGWLEDTSEALALARHVGRRVLAISTSTGGTLLAAAAVDPDAMERVAGLAFMAPNFAINSPFAPMLGWPAARHWLPLIAGRRRRFDVRNPQHGRYWNTDYPSLAVFPVAEAVDLVRGLDMSRAKVPALFRFTEEDKVVRPAATHRVVAAWGGPTRVEQPKMGPGDDIQSHVIAGDILSPGQSQSTVAAILDWCAKDITDAPAKIDVEP